MRQKSCYSERDKERQRVRDAAFACRYFSTEDKKLQSFSLGTVRGIHRVYLLFNLWAPLTVQAEQRNGLRLIETHWYTVYCCNCARWEGRSKNLKLKQKTTKHLWVVIFCLQLKYSKSVRGKCDPAGANWQTIFPLSGSFKALSNRLSWRIDWWLEGRTADRFFHYFNSVANKLKGGRSHNRRERRAIAF